MRTSSNSMPIYSKKMQSQNRRLNSEVPKNCYKNLSQSLSLKNSKLKRLPKYLYLSTFCPSLNWKTTPQYILEVQRVFVPPPIGRWSSNSLEINFLKLDSRGFMMLPLMVGGQRISIVNATRRDGR